MERIRDFHSRYRSSILLPSIRIFVRIFSSAKRWNSRSAGGRPWCKYYPAQARLRKLAKRTHSKWVVYKFDSCIWYLHCHGWFVATTVCVKSKVRLPRVEGRHCGGRGAQWSPTLIMDQWRNWQYATNLESGFWGFESLQEYHSWIINPELTGIDVWGWSPTLWSQEVMVCPYHLRTQVSWATNADPEVYYVPRELINKHSIYKALTWILTQLQSTVQISKHSFLAALFEARVCCFVANAI